MSAHSSRPSKRNTPNTERLSLVAQAYQAISGGIIEGLYAPGQRLVESDLAQELGISRNTLREALYRLTANGLVQIEPFRGAIVATATRKEVMDLIAVRSRFEAFAARCAAARIHLDGLREHAQKVAQPLLADVNGTPRLDDHLWINRQFHDLVLELADNATLNKLIEQLHMPVFMRSFFRIYDDALFQRSLEEHRAIYQAIMAGNQDLAEQRMLAHITHTGELINTLPDEYFKAN